MEIIFQLKILLYITHNEFSYLILEKIINKQTKVSNGLVETMSLMFWMEMVTSDFLVSFIEHMGKQEKYDLILRMMEDVGFFLRKREPKKVMDLQKIIEGL